MPKADADRAPLTFTTALSRHLNWQRKLLKSLSSSSPPLRRKENLRFLILRPGDQLTVCEASGMGDVRAHCFRSAKPKGSKPARMHWDTFMTQGRSQRLSRPIPGLGNVALSLVAAAATAIASRRVLLLENFTQAGQSFGAPMRELLLETSGWAPHVHGKGGEEGGVVDGFAAHDDYSAFDSFCGADLRVTPPAKVWRVFSNQYWLPLLLLNPHHGNLLEGLAEALGHGHGSGGGQAGQAAAAEPRAHAVPEVLHVRAVEEAEAA